MDLDYTGVRPDWYVGHKERRYRERNAERATLERAFGSLGALCDTMNKGDAEFIRHVYGIDRPQLTAEAAGGVVGRSHSRSTVDNVYSTLVRAALRAGGA
jgi:hypothetical protein